MESKRTRSVSLEERRSSKELLKHRESVCTACHRTHTAHAPPFKRCGRCLLAHYCSRDCQTLDWRTHKHQCTSLAVTGLITKYHAATVADIEDEHRGMSYTTLFSVVDTAALPEGLTMAQLDDLLAQARLALPHLSTPWEHLYFHRALSLWDTCARVAKLEPEEQIDEIDQTFMEAVREMLDHTPADSPWWTYISLLSICCQYGEFLCCKSPADAVALGRRLRPLVEAAMERTHEYDGQEGIRHVVSLFFEPYARWLHRAADAAYKALQLPRPGMGTLEELKEEEGVVRRAIELGESISPIAKEVPELYSKLGWVLQVRGNIIEAYKVARKGMQISLERESPAYGDSANQAVTCLVELMRDDQAEALIQEVTAAGERCLDLYGVQVEVRLLNNQGILHRRRGDIMEAFGSHFHAFELCKEYRNEKHGSSLQRVAVETRALVLEVMEGMDMRPDSMRELEELEKGLEATTKDSAMLRPSYIARRSAALLASGKGDEAMPWLRAYAKDYRTKGSTWMNRHRWREGGALKPLHVLRDALEEGSEERAQVQELIDGSAGEDEALRRQALEELQAEMGVARPGEEAGGGGGRSSKAGRKKRKKRKKRQQQQQQQGGEGAVAVAMAGLTLEDSTATDDAEAVEEEGGAAAVGAEEEADECAVCLAEFDGAQEEEVLGCGHRFHGACMDRWLCKCREKGLLPTCPFCRAKVVRGRGSSRV